MSSFCRGCSKSFEGGLFLQHVRKTTNSACKTFGDSIKSNAPSNNNLLQSLLNRHATMTVDEEEQMGMGMAMDSTGDFFGDYSDLENGDIDMQTNVPPLEISDDEDEEDDGFSLDDENGWEPAPEFDPRAPSPDLIFEEGHFDEALHLPHSRPPPPAAPNCIRQPHIIHYPDPNAGAPILSDTRGTSENFRYSQKLDRANTNPWAPFVSEIDWKIAHWAKMRGPSSTAFSELLAIDG
ncbi:hypothetical protein GGU11DRAFT_751001, partial [Lentinula aff. detonsa]